MSVGVALDSVVVPSEDVVARDIGGELILVPLAAGIGDMEDELYALQGTGQAIWNQLDGKSTLAAIVQRLAEEYQASEGELEGDVVGFVQELVRRKLIVEASLGGG